MALLGRHFPLMTYMYLKQESILVEQMRSKKGGQLVEVEAVIGDKVQAVVLCELQSETWVLVHCGEKAQ